MPNWKTDENGALVLKDGNPIYVDTNGDERTVKLETISRLNGEAKEQREAKEAALEKLKQYEGLDAAKAREALEKLKAIDEKQLLDMGKVDELKQQITNNFQTQLNEKETALKELQTKYDDMLIGNVFANSEYVRNNINVPRDMYEAVFRKNFKVENGTVVAYDNNNNRLYSVENAGEFATPEEALKILTEHHPQKEVILRANVPSGSGSNGNGGGNGGGRYIKRSEFMKLSPAQQSAFAAKMRSGEMVLTD